MENLIKRVIENQLTTNEILVKVMEGMNDLKEKTDNMQKDISDLNKKIDTQVNKLSIGLQRLEQKLDDNLDEIANMFNDIYNRKVKKY